MDGVNQWLGPDVRLKGMNALKWATGCADGEETRLETAISPWNLDHGPDERLTGMNGLNRE